MMHTLFISALLLAVLTITAAQSVRCNLKDLRNLDGVSPESPSFTFSGDWASIICEDGYTAESRKPFCRNGTWSSQHLSLCKESDCTVPRYYKGSVKERKPGRLTWTPSGWFQVPQYTTIPQGTIVSSRDQLWLFCDKLHTVLGDGRDKALIRCFKGRLSPDLQCLRDERGYVPSTAEPASVHFTPTLAPSRSSSATTANYMPSSTPRSSWNVNCSSPANVDEEKIHGVVSTSVPTEPPVEECFCKYPVDDTRIIAQSDGKKLMHGDKVPNGSSVEFRCLHVGYDRFRGRRKITCSDCRNWHSSDIPSCTKPREGDAVILLSSNSNVLADGTVELLKGKTVNLTCAAMGSAPKWNAPQVPGIFSIRERSDRKEDGDIVHFTHLEIENADYEHEGTYECSVEGKRETSIRIIVSGDCEIPGIDRGSIKEQKLGEWNWTRSGWVQALNYITIPQGTIVSSRDVLWFFCDKPHTVLGDGRERAQVRCFKGRWSTDLQCLRGIGCEKLDTTDLLQIHYSNDQEVGSIATFHCPSAAKRIGASFAKCLENSTWSHPTPVCECESNCKFPRKPPGSKLILSPERTEYGIGERLTFSCPPGMSLTTGLEMIMCLSSGWSETVLPDCERNES